MKKTIKTLAATAVIGLMAVAPASAGTIWVVPDVNSFSGTDSTGLLNTATAGNTNIGHVTSNDGSTARFITRSGSNAIADFSAGSLSTIDLLVLGGPTFFSSGLLGLSAGEISNIGGFLSNGGDVMFQVETTTQPHYDSYNAFLAGIGSDIRFTGERAVIAENFGTGFYRCNACNVLSGGTALAVFTNAGFVGKTALASDEIGRTPPPPPNLVPVPAALPLLAGGLGIMGFMGWRRKRNTA